MTLKKSLKKFLKRIWQVIPSHKMPPIKLDLYETPLVDRKQVLFRNSNHLFASLLVDRLLNQHSVEWVADSQFTLSS